MDPCFWSFADCMPHDVNMAIDFYSEDRELLEEELDRIADELVILKEFKFNIQSFLREDLSSNGLVEDYRILNKIYSSCEVLKQNPAYWKGLMRLYSKQIYHGGKALEILTSLILDYSKI